MAWFRKEKKRRTSKRERLEIPPDVWDKCEQCGTVDIRDKFEKALQVCPDCGHHRRYTAQGYLDLLTDTDSFEELYADVESTDPLGFEGYPERIARAQKKSGTKDAVITGDATLAGIDICLCVMSFAFMGGSMGSAVGEKIARLVDRARKKKRPLIIVSMSGGARMQEGVLSLMQLAKTSAAIARFKDAGLPYISILTNPTTGGVSASYAMQGDINIAEPGAVIGFAGPRVIKQTIGQDLPAGFQTSEFLLEHGMLDMVVPRHKLNATTAGVLSMMLGRPGTVSA